MRSAIMTENFPDVDLTGRQLTDAESTEFERQLAEKRIELERCQAGSIECARLQLDSAEILIWLERNGEARELARGAFDTALRTEAWQDAVEACNVLYQCGRADSLAALGMGVWLAVTYPVEPQLTYAMLDHIVTETPDDSDAAALAAVAARYVIDLRADDASHPDWSLLANNLIATVAQRHGMVRDQQGLDAWMDRLELRDPRVFLPRLGRVVDALVGDAWWFDRDALRDKIPG